MPRRYLAAAALAWLDARYGWITPAFDAIARQFYESPLLASIRRPTQLVFCAASCPGRGAVRARPPVGGKLDQHGRRWLAVFALGYALRAAVWICGSNLPLVPGDSCHYIEVATSVLRGEGPVKHYVGSFFKDYPHIRESRGGLDDWDTPLYSIWLRWRGWWVSLAISPVLARLAVAKGCSFIFNVLCLPALYVFARWRFNPRLRWHRWPRWRCSRCMRFMPASC